MSPPAPGGPGRHPADGTAPRHPPGRNPDPGTGRLERLDWEPDPGAAQDRPSWLPPPPPAPGSPAGSPGPPAPGWAPGPPGPRSPAPRGWTAAPPPEGPRGRRVGPLVAGLVLLLVVGLGLGGLAFAGRRDRPAPAAGGTTGTPATQAPATQPPATQAPSASATRAGIGEVEQAVAQLRGLRFERPVPVTVESPAKLARRLVRVLGDETDEAKLRRQGRAMELLGELPPGTDLPALLERVQAESVLGFYLPGRRPPKGSLYVRSTSGLDPYTRIILAHELTHAVTDQRYDLTRADRLAAANAREDELAAYSGLVEGDATLLMQQYLTERLTPAEQASAGLAAAADRTPQRDAAPPVIRESLLFPYQEGLAFVRALYQQGGWAAVNRAYRDPPTSTEQLLHPERYLGDRDQPQPVAVANLSGRLGGGWRPSAEQSVGEFDLRLLLQGQLAVTTAQTAAAGWDGGRLRTFQQGSRTALVMRTVWDSGAEATQFCGAMSGWATGRFGAATRTGGTLRWSSPAQRTTLVCRGSRVAWLSAPDRPTLDRLTAALGPP